VLLDVSDLFQRFHAGLMVCDMRSAEAIFASGFCYGDLSLENLEDYRGLPSRGPWLDRFGSGVG